MMRTNVNLVTSREYPRRAAKAADTRRRIVGAAVELFIELGYPATTIAAIAERADVAAQTVYAAFGNKRVLLEQALDVTIAGDDEPVPVNDRPWMAPVWRATSGADTLRAYAAAVCTIQGRAAPLFEALDIAVAAEPELRDLHGVSRERRRIGAGGVVDAVRRLGDLREDLTRGEAVDVLWLLNGHHPFLAMVRDRGWSRRRYERWLGETMVTALVRPAATTTPPSMSR